MMLGQLEQGGIPFPTPERRDTRALEEDLCRFNCRFDWVAAIGKTLGTKTRHTLQCGAHRGFETRRAAHIEIRVLASELNLAPEEGGGVGLADDRLELLRGQQARTPKKTLSFETGSVAALLVVVAPYLCASAANCQSLAVVSRQTI